MGRGFYVSGPMEDSYVSGIVRAIVLLHRNSPTGSRRTVPRRGLQGSIEVPRKVQSGTIKDNGGTIEGVGGLRPRERSEPSSTEQRNTSDPSIYRCMYRVGQCRALKGPF